MDGCASIYGVNVNEKITPVVVRDAIIECYYKADLEVLDELFQTSDFKSGEDEQRSKRKHVKL